MAMSLSDQPRPTPSSSSSQPRKTQSSSTASAPVMQPTDELPMYRDIPSAPSYEPLPEPEYSNPQVSVGCCSENDSAMQTPYSNV